jgi:hypothetical protein
VLKHLPSVYHGTKLLENYQLSSCNVSTDFTNVSYIIWVKKKTLVFNFHTYIFSANEYWVWYCAIQQCLENSRIFNISFCFWFEQQHKPIFQIRFKITCRRYLTLHTPFLKQLNAICMHVSTWILSHCKLFGCHQPQYKPLYTVFK